MEAQIHGPVTGRDVAKVFVSSYTVEDYRKESNVDFVAHLKSAFPDAEIVLTENGRDFSAQATKLSVMRVTSDTPRTFEFACHAASCRPPGSGGTGGSSLQVSVKGHVGEISEVAPRHVHYTTSVSPGHDVHGQDHTPAGAIKKIAEAHDRPHDAGVPSRSRAEMPQIPKALKPAFDKFLAGHGVSSWQESVPTRKLKPTQTQIDPARADALHRSGTLKSHPIGVSRDNMILDGHHRWAGAQRAHVLRVPVTRYSAPMASLIRLADQFNKLNGVKHRTQPPSATPPPRHNKVKVTFPRDRSADLEAWRKLHSA
jgi:hypothetical protein